MHAFTASLLSLLLMTPMASGWLGVYLALDSKEAVVTEVIPGTPAEKAGLKSGDVLLAVDDTATPTRDQFVAAIQAIEPGSRVKIKLRRDQRERVVVVRLGERPADVGAGEPPAPPAPPVHTGRAPRALAPEPAAPALEVSERPQGAVASNQGDSGQGGDEKGYLGISVREGDDGLILDRILEDGPCAESSLRKGDVLQSIGDHRIRSLDDLDSALKQIHPGQQVAVGVRSGTTKKSLMVTVGRRPGQGRVAISKQLEVTEIETVAAPAIELKPGVEGRVIRLVPRGHGEGHGEEVVIEVAGHEVKPEAVKPEAVKPDAVKPDAVKPDAVKPEAVKPERAIRITRPARRTPATESASPAHSSRPAASARLAKPTPAAGAEATEYNLERELKELRQELKELRRLLEQMRKDKKGGE